MSQSKVVIPFVLLLLLPTVVTVLAQVRFSVTVTTNKASIKSGDVLTLSGNVSASGSPVRDALVAYEIHKPDNSILASGFTQTGADGSYTASLVIPSSAPSGQYKVIVSVISQGANASAVANFTVGVLQTSTGTTISTTTGTTQQQKRGCLIATAAFGSQLAPDVRFLRDFRDTVIMASPLGSQFMLAFDGWYYSFSPQIASTVENNYLARDLMKIVLVPTIITLQTAGIFRQNPMGTYSVIVYGFFIGTILGALYIGPFLTVAAGRKRYNTILKQSVLLAGVASALLLASELSSWFVLIEISSVLYVLSSAILGATITAFSVRRLYG